MNKTSSKAIFEYGKNKQHMIRNPYSEHSKALASANWSLVCLALSFLAFFAMFLTDISIDWCISISLFSAIVTLALSVYSLWKRQTTSGLIGLMGSGLILITYLILAYLIKDMCVIC